MQSIRWIGRALATCSLAAGLARADAVAVFADDFETAALLAEKWAVTPAADWRVADGGLAVTGGKTASAAPRGLDLEGPLTVSLRLKVPAFGGGGGWAGVIVRGVHFTLRSSSFWHVYRIAGQERSLGGVRNVARVEPGRWYAFRIEQAGDRYRWFVDGEPVADFLEPNPVLGGARALALAVSGGPGAVYDDVAVAPLAEGGTLSPNHLRNASFEEVSDVVPPYWKPWGMPSVPPERLWARWGVSDEGAWHGGRALRVATVAGEASGFVSHQGGMTVGKPCTFSVWLKADRPGFKAQLIYWEYPAGRWSKQAVTLDTAWGRHVFTLDSPSNTSVRAGVLAAPEQEGVFWADAAQLEAGAAATPFALSALDAAAEREALPTQAPRELAVAAAAPVLDGRLDDAVWNDASRVWNLVLPGGAAPREKTEAFLVLAGETLYIGMRCHDSEMAKLKASVTDHDGPVYGDDCVEFLLDTRHDQRSYHHLVVNALGTRFDAGPGRDISWNHAWEARAFRGDTGWSVEAALPLASFGPSPALAQTWGVNLCRANHKAGEWSSTAITRSANFHLPERYPELRWPEDAFVRLCVVPEGLTLLRGGDGAILLRGALANRSGAPRRVAVCAAAPGETWGSAAIDLPAHGRAPFSAAGLTAPPDAAELRVRGVVREAGEGGADLHAFSLLLPVGRPLEGALERSFYSTEPEARFLAALALPDAERTAGRLAWRLGEAEGTVAGNDLGPSQTVAIPLAGVPPGKHALRVRLLAADGSETAALETTLEKRLPSRSAVPVDRLRRCLVVDDQPFFVFAPLFQLFAHQKPEEIDAVVNHFADAGFRAMMVVGHSIPAWTEAKWARYFGQCAARGLKVIAWPGGFHREPDEAFAPFIERWRDHPALIAWLPVDEPELYATPEETAATIAFFQRHDPYHPVYANNTVMGIPSRFAGLPGDLLSIDDYLTNREGRSVSEILHQVGIMEAAARATRRPVWIFLVGNNLHNHFREPTPGEQVAQTYGSALSGASGLIYFMGYPVDRGHWRMLCQLNRELLALGPVLLSPEPAPAATCSSAAVRFGTRRVGSSLYLIAVNIEPEPVSAAFTVAGVDDAEVSVVFEERLTAFAKGVLNDRFEPYERHVYRLRGSGGEP